MTESFRQAGREKQGKLYRGPVVDAFNRLTQPSIPSEHEQVLTSIEKRGGFGATSDRFNYSQQQSPQEGPGPCEYIGVRYVSSPSHSRRGYGSIISREDRFKRFQYNTVAPGPGFYKLRNRPLQSPVKYMSGKASNSISNDEYPSPGYYDPKLASSARVVTSTFKSSTRKNANFSKDTPSPGQYKTDCEISPNKYPSPAFKLPVKARRYQVNLYDPHTQIQQASSPGPGAYFSPGIDKDDEKKNSHMFFKNDLDRFGQKNEGKFDKTPGPGTYHVNTHNIAKIKVSGAVFMSESDRSWLPNEKKPPGPAFYKPIPVPKRKSFHLNSNNQWL